MHTHIFTRSDAHNHAFSHDRTYRHLHAQIRTRAHSRVQPSMPPVYTYPFLYSRHVILHRGHVRERARARRARQSRQRAHERTCAVQTVAKRCIALTRTHGPLSHHRIPAPSQPLRSANSHSSLTPRQSRYPAQPHHNCSPHPIPLRLRHCPANLLLFSLLPRPSAAGPAWSARVSTDESLLHHARAMAAEARMNPKILSMTRFLHTRRNNVSLQAQEHMMRRPCASFFAMVLPGNYFWVDHKFLATNKNVRNWRASSCGDKKTHPVWSSSRLYYPFGKAPGQH